jgi:hypothetical protein
MAKCALTRCGHLLLAFFASLPDAQIDRGGNLSARQHLEGQRLTDEKMTRIVA